MQGPTESSRREPSFSRDAVPVRVLIADSDCVLAGELVAALARKETRVRVVGLACDAEGAVALAGVGRPDVILLGTVGGPPLEAVVEVLRDGSEASIVVLADERKGVGATECQLAGVAGFVPRGQGPEGIAASLFEVALVARASSSDAQA